MGNLGNWKKKSNRKLGTKHTISEMKNYVDSLSTILDKADERISEQEDRSEEISRATNEEGEGRKMQKIV